LDKFISFFYFNLSNNKTNLSFRNFSVLNKIFTEQESKIPLNLDIKFLHWLAGFTDGEGSFSINITNSKSKKNKDFNKYINFRFRIRLHIDDVDVLYKIQNKLGIGKVFLQKGISECIFVVSKFEDIKNIIIPIFNFTNLYTSKSIDFKNFCLAF
jgi:hypothetical protein